MDVLENESADPDAPMEAPASPKIFADIVSGFTYASYQNAVPVLRSIGIENRTDRTFGSLRLELSSIPDELELVSAADLPAPKMFAHSLPPEPSELSAPSGAGAYRVTDLSPFSARPELFYEFAYRDTLKGMIEAVIEAESPLPADVLAQRVARAHGWLRTGGRIRERIDLHLRGYDTTAESTGVFVWKKGHVASIVPYRPSAHEESRRSIAEIAMAELVSVVITNPDLLDMPDPARDMARLLGVERLAASARTRLDEAITHARTRMAGQPMGSV